MPPLMMKLLTKLIKQSRFVWDFDDNILFGKEMLEPEWNLYCQNAETIVVTGEYLKELLPKEAQERTIFLPTTDTEVYVKDKEELKQVIEKRKQQAKTEIVLVWLASSANIKFLDYVIDTLDKTAEQLKEKTGKTLVLKVICDKNTEKKVKYLKIDFVSWKRKIVQEELEKSYIGIMPLIDNEYTRGKGGFKLVQYIATGLPIIASNVGFNKNFFIKDVGELVNDIKMTDCWKEAILKLALDQNHWEECSYQAYEVWRQEFHFQKNIDTWRKILGQEEKKKT